MCLSENELKAKVCSSSSCFTFFVAKHLQVKYLPSFHLAQSHAEHCSTQVCMEKWSFSICAAWQRSATFCFLHFSLLLPIAKLK